MTDRASEPERRRIRRDDDWDNWEPPRWTHPRLSESDLPRERGVTAGRLNRQEPAGARTLGAVPLYTFALAPAVMGVLSALMLVSSTLYGRGDVPRGVILVLAAAVGGTIVAVRQEQRELAAICLGLVFTLAVLLPLISLQVSMLHEPFVSFERRSATPALATTVLVVFLIGLYAFWCVWQAGWREELAAITFMPAALTTPSIIGHPETIDQADALLTLAEVGIVSAVVIAAVWFFPGWPQALCGAIGLALEFLLLLVTGRGPWREATAGAIVPAVYIAMLILVSVLVVAVPIAVIARAGKRTARGR